jgi:hypothetical protein
MSGILNANIRLQEFNSTYVYRGNSLAQTFLGGRARERKFISAGTVLWKCTEYSLVNPANGAISEFWCSAEDLDGILQRCINLGVSLRRYARARLAVKWEWNNSMENMLRTRTLQPIYAFVGPTKWQNSHFTIDKEKTGLSDNRLALIGGDTQYCIPNLTTAHIAEVSRTSADQMPAGWQKMQAFPGGRAV